MPGNRFFEAHRKEGCMDCSKRLRSKKELNDIEVNDVWYRKVADPDKTCDENLVASFMSQWVDGVDNYLIMKLLAVPIGCLGNFEFMIVVRHQFYSLSAWTQSPQPSLTHLLKRK